MMITQNQIRISTTLPSNYITAGLVLSGGGCCKALLARDYKDSKRVLIRRTNNDKQSDRDCVSNA